MIALLTTFFLAVPFAQAEETDSEEEFSFIEEGEKNRAKAESQRAPAADLFLQDDDEEDVTTWAAPSNDTAEIIEDEFEFSQSPDLSTPLYESDDPEEDMEEFGPSVSNLTPLGDNFPLQIGPDGLGGVAAELPVLVARNSAELPGQIWVVADVYADGVKVGESRHLVGPESLSEVGPTYIWIKAGIPVQGPSVAVEVRVFASPPGKKEQALFTRSAQLAL